MNHCPNCTNKLYLEPIIYPDSDRRNYYVTQEAVNEILERGEIPEVVLPEAKYADNAPKIAVLLTRDKHPDRALADYSMPQTIVDAITLSGGKPCFITHEKVAEHLARISPDGIFLPGGSFDVPLSWEIGEAPHEVNLQRVEAYITNIEYAKQHNLPLLGVCGGMQVLACVYGAKIARVAGHSSNLKEFAHKMEITPNSFLSRLLRADAIEVNSWHKWAVSKEICGDNILHFSPDGVVEAVEPKAKWHDFVLGLQSHPEYFVKSGYEPAVNLFKSFIEACNNGR